MLSFQDILDARERIRGIAHQTPLTRAHSIGKAVGCELYLKAENLQRTGSFKIRGAANKVSQLSAAERARGIVAASAGNHAQGVALAARREGVAATVVMPRDAPFAKVEATRNYGATVVLHGHSFDEAMEKALELVSEKGLILVHAYDDPEIIAGQGTVGLEILDEVPDLQVLLVPIGGGGLIAGTALAVKERAPHARVIGVQAAAAPAWAEAYGKRVLDPLPPALTVADGIAVGHPGAEPSELIWKYVDDVVKVGEEKIAQAMLLLLEWGKLLVEGAGAVGLAAILEHAVDVQGKKTVALLSGGNVDPTTLSRIVEQGLAEAGRFMILRVIIQDRPGRLAHMLESVAQAEGNVLEVYHHRKGILLPVGQVEVELLLETKDRAHGEAVLAALSKAGYRARGLTPTTSQRPVVRRLIARDMTGR